MTTNHTPGPWDFKVAATGAAIVKPEGSKYMVAEVRGGGAANEANARLIASAPDLLAALEQIADVPRSINESDCWPREWQMIQLARAAIARAKGE